MPAFHEQPKSGKEISCLDSQSGDLHRISAGDISGELQRRLEGKERGNVSVGSEEKSTEATLSLDLIYALGKKDPKLAEKFLEATKEKRKEFHKKEAAYLNALDTELVGPRHWDQPELQEVLTSSKIGEMREKLDELFEEADDVLDGSSLRLINELKGLLDNISGDLLDGRSFETKHGRLSIVGNAFRNMVRGAALAFGANVEEK